MHQRHAGPVKRSSCCGSELLYWRRFKNDSTSQWWQCRTCGQPCSPASQGLAFLIEKLKQPPGPGEGTPP